VSPFLPFSQEAVVWSKKRVESSERKKEIFLALRLQRKIRLQRNKQEPPRREEIVIITVVLNFGKRSSQHTKAEKRSFYSSEVFPGKSQVNHGATEFQQQLGSEKYKSGGDMVRPRRGDQTNLQTRAEDGCSALHAALHVSCSQTTGSSS
jgi:hypothetical protein